MRLAPFIIKDSLHLIMVVDSSLAGDFEQSSESCNLQSSCQALSCRVSGSKGTMFYIVGQRDQLTAVDVVEAERGKRVWGEAAGWRGWGCVLCLWLCLSVSAVPVLPDPRCQLLSFQNLGADLRRYRVAGLSHGSPIGRWWPEASAVAEYPGCLFNGAL